MQLTIEEAFLMVGMVASVIVWIEARLASKLGKREHKETCDAHHKEIKADMDEIKGMINKNQERADDHREKVQNSLAEIRTKIAVIQERHGESMFDDAGRLRGR